MENIRYIKKVEIKNLWNKYDIEWNLNEDVNILAGINGSGKTTILNLIFGTIYGQLEERIMAMVDNVKITFNNDEYKAYVNTFINEEFSPKTTTILKLYKFGDIDKKEAMFFGNLQNTKKDDYHEQLALGIDIISTFDQRLKVYEAVRTITDGEVSTELDLQIYRLQKKYFEYQINIGKKAIEALSSKKTVNDVQNRIDFKKNLFLDTIDALFEPTDKRIDRNKNELIFKSGKQVLTPYMLSSGEKQLIIILLTALIQEDRSFMLFIDEPEISLHTDWQENLIDNIRSLNNNAQIIIATHSPSIVLDGWMDKVFEVPEIIKKTKKL